MELADFGNIAAIVSVPLMLLTWLCTRERFAKFWKSGAKWVILVITILLASVGLWRIGWLTWLQYQVTWPIWGLLLYPVALLIILLGVSLLILYIRRTPTQTPSQKYYEIYGARWYLYSDGRDFVPVPVCANCLMDMRNESDRYSQYKVWTCRQCGHKIEWDSSEKGDLLQDVAAHYNASLRRATEGQRSEIQKRDRR
jgi:ribosomal protein L37AE/L43A